VEINVQINDPIALPCGTNHDAYLAEGCLGPRSGLGFWRQEEFLVVVGNRIPECPVHSILTALATL
jgi:hypothetical protein